MLGLKPEFWFLVHASLCKENLFFNIKSSPKSPYLNAIEVLISIFLSSKLAHISSYVDGESMSKFSNLNRISLMKFDLENFLTKGLEWMNYLNTKSSKYFDIVFDGKLFPYHDSDLCLFSHFPFENKIIALFDLELDSPDFFLPCSCVIYWLHKNYLNYSHLVKNDSRYSNLFPFHCLDQDPILIEEQNNFCDNENSVLQCGQPLSQNFTHPPPQGVNQSCFLNPDENGKLCTCNIGSVNILECSSQLISSMPSDLSSPHAWDYVSFKASSIRVIDSFQNLSLNLAATI
ncbi:hypothetical protein BpHYR1_035768 [Brachionus plicatilis]|uniref:Uncharacterized protein n=1 Tax=Brachionus plicatilis TaxID=10195 RepID=A0A3M7P8I2_BRAPC|nr:hypothetical protein BpHYR1_035768 [Brachionus plicatilis]